MKRTAPRRVAALATSLAVAAGLGACGGSTPRAAVVQHAPACPFHVWRKGVGQANIEVEVRSEQAKRQLERSCPGLPLEITVNRSLPVLVSTKKLNEAVAADRRRVQAERAMSDLEHQIEATAAKQPAFRACASRFPKQPNETSGAQGARAIKIASQCKLPPGPRVPGTIVGTN